MGDSLADLRPGQKARLAREKRTLQVMVGIYCRGHHAGHGSLCDECQSLYDYAIGRLNLCPYGPKKTTCARCPTHCYRPAMRDRIKIVMRYSGRRMLYQHPILALFHMLDAMRKPN